MPNSKATLTDAGLLVLRIGGAFLAVHGWQKVAAAMSGPSTWGFVDAVRGMGFPAPAVFAWAAAVSELLGAVAVGLGIYTRFAAFSCAVTMFVAAFIAHGSDGFDKREMALLYLAIMLGLTFTGGGALRVDSFWRKG